METMRSILWTRAGTQVLIPAVENRIFEEPGVRAMCWHSTERGVTNVD
jgi:hypothetical protein